MKHSTLTLITLCIILFLSGCNNKEPQNNSLKTDSSKEVKPSDVPNEQSLLDAVNYDLTTYGWNYYSDMVNYQAQGAGTSFDYKRESPSLWRNHGVGVSSYIKIVKVNIQENESDRFPYKGEVVINRWTRYDNPKANVGAKTYAGQINYYWGKNTKKWIRKENIVQ